MKSIVAYSVNAAEWDAAVTRLGGGPFHASMWAQYTKSLFPNSKSVWFLLRDDAGSIAGLARGMLQKTHLNLIRNLYFECMPLCDSTGADPTRLIPFIERYSDQQRIHFVSFDSFNPRANSEEIRSKGYALKRRVEFIFDLRKSAEELWAGLAHGRQKSIKASSSKNLEVHEQSDSDGVAILRSLQLQSAERILNRGGPDISFKGQPSEDPISTLLKTGLARIFVARADGEALSARLVAKFNGQVYAISGGHSSLGLRKNSSTFLHWELIKLLKTEGAVEYNLGGCKADAKCPTSPEHGVYEYKKLFGAQEIDCVSAERCLRPIEARAYEFLKGVKKRIAVRG